ncbi:unnamed protein product [Coffea canephora]|uniref:Uncharacterized protein n=1 Tax=Coffea canephora TaxID=49390 RepID=A0A068U5S7_COFCA|nr:unnamed protein product [Coffea canephora]
MLMKEPKLIFSSTKLLAIRALMTLHLGMIRFSKLYRRTVGNRTTAAGCHFIWLTRKSMVLMIFCSEQSIHSGCDRKTNKISSSETPHLR